MRARVATVAALVTVVGACGERADERPPPPPPADAAPPPADAAPSVRELSEATGIDAWQAVIDRDRYLARRGDEVAVVGRLGPTVGDDRWLVDDGEGEGLLAIRVALPAYARGLADHERVQVQGAWEVGPERRWRLRAREVGRVAGAPSYAPTYAPGHELEVLEQAPEAALPPSQVARRGETVFYVVAKPLRYGDGWQIADERGDEPVAWLWLPGERAIYGGQNLLTPDERWPLKVGGRYVVAVRRARDGRGEGAMRTIRAAGPPRAVR